MLRTPLRMAREAAVTNGPGGIEDGGARQNEQEDLEPHPEGRPRRYSEPTLRVLHGQRRVSKDGNGEEETDPEAPPHVTDHRLHVHSGAVAHLVGDRVACRVRRVCSRWQRSNGFLPRVLRLAQMLRHDVSATVVAAFP